MSTRYDLNDLIEQARSRWLTASEMHFLLQNYQSWMIRDPVVEKPPSGSVFIYDKKNTRFFRDDGYSWCKKPNKNSVNEGHEKLKVGGVAVIDCYYAKREDNPHFMRRIYWLLDQEKKHIALVHYRDTNEVTYQGNTDFASLLEELLENEVSEQPLMDHGENLTAAGIDTSALEVEMLSHHSTCQEIVVQDASTPVYYERTPIPVSCSMLLLPNQAQSPQHKFEIKDVSPDWCYANESAKVVIIGSCHCDSSELAWAVFDGREVPIQIMQDGVFRCHAPPKCTTGKVTLWIASRNGDVCSEVKEFEYRDRVLEQYRNVAEFQLIVDSVQMLLSDLSLQNGCDLALLTGSGTSSCTKDRVLQVLLKNHLEQWFLTRPFYGDCNISRNEEELIVHVVGGLGYEWALNPMLVSGVGVDAQDANGWTALHWAARFGRETVVLDLLSNGASVDAMTHPTAEKPMAETPASIARAHGHGRLAACLFFLESIPPLLMSSPARFKKGHSELRLRVEFGGKSIQGDIRFFVPLIVQHLETNGLSKWIHLFRLRCPALFEDLSSITIVSGGLIDSFVNSLPLVRWVDSNSTFEDHGSGLFGHILKADFVGCIAECISQELPVITNWANYTY